MGEPVALHLARPTVKPLLALWEKMTGKMATPAMVKEFEEGETALETLTRFAAEKAKDPEP